MYRHAMRCAPWHTGGAGFVHYNMTAEEQIANVLTVKAHRLGAAAIPLAIPHCLLIVYRCTRTHSPRPPSLPGLLVSAAAHLAAPSGYHVGVTCQVSAVSKLS